MQPYRASRKLKSNLTSRGEQGKRRLSTIDSEDESDQTPHSPPRPPTTITSTTTSNAIDTAASTPYASPTTTATNIVTGEYIGSGSRWPIPEYRVLEFVRARIQRLWPYARILGRRTRLSLDHPPATRYWTIVSDDPRGTFAPSLGGCYRSRFEFASIKPVTTAGALTRWPSSAWRDIKNACGSINLNISINIRPCVSPTDTLDDDDDIYNNGTSDRDEDLYRSEYGRRNGLNAAERKWLLGLLLSQTSFGMPQSWMDHVLFQESPSADHAVWPWIAVSYPQGRLCLCIGD